ncbi:MAG: ribose 5-phosphate isomerase B [Gemmatimonadales bacterium]|nr:ribose 5-phosphate isomerase B [Gemmatimonadales bacterium]
MPEHIPIGADHAGVALKQRLVAWLQAEGFAPDDVGTDSEASVDYPDFAHEVAGRVERGEVRRGILICGSGVGMSIAANRHPGVRASLVWTPEVAQATREHNDSNVLCLPARFLTPEQGIEIVRTWLGTGFEGGRHARRVAKIDQEP